MRRIDGSKGEARGLRIAVAGIILLFGFGSDLAGETHVLTFSLKAESSLPVTVSVLSVESRAARLARMLEPRQHKAPVLANWSGMVDKSRQVELPLEDPGPVRVEVQTASGTWTLPVAFSGTELPLLDLSASAQFKDRPWRQQSNGRPAEAEFIYWRPETHGCGPQWHPAALWLRKSRDEVSNLVGLAPDSDAYVFEPHSGVRRAGRTDRALSSTSQELQDVTREILLGPSPEDAFGVLLFGDESVPLGVLQRDRPLRIAAPPGNWRLRVLTASGYEGTWEGRVDQEEDPKPLVLTPTPTTSLEFRFEDVEGRPVPGVLAWLAGEPFWWGSEEAERGRVVIARLPQRRRLSICVLPPWGGALSLPVETGGTEVPREVVVRLRPGEKAEAARPPHAIGTLFEKDGAAARRVQVIAAPDLDPAKLGLLLGARSLDAIRGIRTSTDDNGDFRLEGLREGVPWTLAAIPEEGAPFVLEELVPRPGEGEIDLGVRVLPEGRSVGGRVYGVDGRELSNATLTAVLGELEAGWSGLREGGRTTRTDADGRFRLTGLPTEPPLVVWAQADGYLPKGLEVAPTAEPDDLDFHLSRAARIAGRVVTSEGSPIEGARIRLVAGAAAGVVREGASFTMRRVPVRSGPDGQFLIPELPCTRFGISVSAEGYRALETEVTASCAEGEPAAEIRLERGPVWTGKLLDSSGRPVAGASIGVEEGRLALTAPDGSFRVGFEEEGTWQVIVQVAGQPEYRTSVSIAGGDLDQDVRLP